MAALLSAKSKGVNTPCYNLPMTDEPQDNEEDEYDDFRNGVGLGWKDAEFGSRSKEEWEHWKATGRYRDRPLTFREAVKRISATLQEAPPDLKAQLVQDVTKLIAAHEAERLRWSGELGK